MKMSKETFKWLKIPCMKLVTDSWAFIFSALGYCCLLTLAVRAITDTLSIYLWRHRPRHTNRGYFGYGINLPMEHTHSDWVTKKQNKDIDLYNLPNNKSSVDTDLWPGIGFYDNYMYLIHQGNIQSKAYSHKSLDARSYLAPFVLVLYW